MDTYSLADAAKDAKTEAMIAARNQTYSIYSNNVVTEQAEDLMLTGRVLAFATSAIGTMLNFGNTKRSIDQDSKDSIEEQMGSEKQEKEVLLIADIANLNKLLPTEVKSTELWEDESLSNSQDSTLKQLKRDIERDVLCINGVKILGGGGIGLVLEEMFKAIDIACASCYKHPSSLSNQWKKDFSIFSLQKAARTNSGGQSFSAIQSLIDLSSILIIPQSSLATPLLINIHMGANDGEVGIKATIYTETIFELKQLDPVPVNTDTIPNSSDDPDNNRPGNSDTNHKKGISINDCNSESGSGGLILSVQYENFVFMPIRSKPPNFGDICSGDDIYDSADNNNNSSVDNSMDKDEDESFSSYQITSERYITVGSGLLKLRRHFS